MYFEQYLEFENILKKSFPGSDVKASEDRDKYQIHFIHDQKLKKVLNLPLEQRLLSICIIGKFGGIRKTLLKQKSDNRISIAMMLAVEDEHGLLSEIMPKQINIFHCPESLYIETAFYFDLEKDKLATKYHKEINIKKNIEKLLRKHLYPAKPFLGLFKRVCRVIKWIILPPILDIFANIFKWQIYITSGKKAKLDKSLTTLETFGFRNNFDNINIPVSVVITNEQKVSFFGLDIAPIPLFFYSVLHLTMYFVYKIFNLNIHILKPLIENNFLNILYVIVSYFIYETVFTKTGVFCINKIWNLYLNLTEPLIRRVVISRR